jgi:hypothetical protein
MSDHGMKSIDCAALRERCIAYGIVAGNRIDVRDLDQLSRSWEIDTYLYFEDDLARESDLETDLNTYAGVPEFNRPFVKLDVFLKFGEENDPTFTQRLIEFPLMVEIVNVGEYAKTPSAPYIKALMPFLDDVDFDKDPVEDGFITL